MSGVSRLRQSRKNHSLRTLGSEAAPGGAHKDSVGSPDVDVNVGSDLAPKKAESLKGYVGNTPPPQGRALPVRGEGPTRNVETI
jgi:hypothetical protein